MQDKHLYDSYRSETAAKRKALLDRSNVSQPEVFQVTKCAACGGQLDLPSIHFMCKHSYHQRFVLFIKHNERLADHGLGNSDVYRTLIQSAPSVLDNIQLSVNFDEISSAWRTGTTCFWEKCIRQKMGSVLWRMRLGEGCLGEKGLMKRLRLKGRSSTVCGKRRVCHVHNAACLYRILSCGLQRFVYSSRGRCCQA